MSIKVSESRGRYHPPSLCSLTKRPGHINGTRLAASIARSGPRSPTVRAGRGGIGTAQRSTARSSKTAHRITLDAINRMRSPETCKIMIGRYRAADETQGRAAYLHDCGADCLDDDPAFGTLWCRDSRGDEPLMMLEVRTARPNPSARASTTSCASIHNCDPMLSDGSFGPPQLLKARHAVASIFGLTGATYEPESRRK